MPERRSCSIWRLGRSSVSKLAIGKAAQPLWHTSAAAAPAHAVCQNPRALASFIWFALVMWVSTIAIGVKSSVRWKIFDWGVKRFAVCCAPQESALCASVVPPPNASAA